MPTQTPQGEDSMEQTQQMQTLLEIKAELGELAKLDFDLKEPLQVLNTHADSLKEEVEANITHALREVNIHSKRLLSMHLYRALAYQDIITNIKGEVLFYGDVYMQGLSVNNNTGSGRANGAVFSRVPLPCDIEFIEVFGGHTTFYALPKEGNFLYVWGSNVEGSAGVGNTTALTLPVRVDFPARVLKVCCGTSESNAKQSAIALLENGLVYVCGSNTIGELGVGNTLPLSAWTQNPHLSDIQDIFLCSNGNAGMFMAIDNEGALYVCGHNQQGACGNGANANLTLPFKLSFNQKVKLAKASITASNAHYCTAMIVLEDGSVRGAGYALENNLSQSAVGNINIFTTLLDERGEPLSGIVDIFPASIGGTALALDCDGNLYAWGRGAFGYGNDNTAVNAKAAIVLENVESVQHWDRANTRVVAKIKDSQTLLAFGFNTDGALGIGNVLNTRIWQQVPLPPAFKQYKLQCFGAEAHLVVIADNEIYACGTTRDGSLKYTTPTLQKQ
ncbi:hypothetical protein OQH61_08680 [Helicobacter sp. MIT 21-1697]|uniref:RCC1 domain-containing protein n=1 Tax=Helicobacter sp. MIT 21-1697 TaxID=2993733 RepID=UPI00224B69AE|nr:hypothetical protein [Helicobacter sp. MIT 21-1697]MCX2717805.1 hypothetical protein [Helicobacter sp. MIT 21-1697]